jgi:hypothetical protein
MTPSPSYVADTFPSPQTTEHKHDPTPPVDGIPTGAPTPPSLLARINFRTRDLKKNPEDRDLLDFSGIVNCLAPTNKYNFRTRDPKDRDPLDTSGIVNCLALTNKY